MKIPDLSVFCVKPAPAATGKCIRMSSRYMWFDSLTLDNVGSIGFKLDDRSGGAAQGFGAVIRKITGLDLVSGCDGCNSGYFFWVRYDDGESWFDTVQNSTFSNMSASSCAHKIYTNINGLYETSTYATSSTEEGTIALKYAAVGYTVRANIFNSDIPTGVGGNMNGSINPGYTGGEIYHNLCLGSGSLDSEGCITLVVAEIEHNTPVWVYRNTFLGVVKIANTVTADGPYTFNNNVQLNSQAAVGSCPQYYTCFNVTDYSRLVDGGTNVKGANDGTIANATTGVLVGASRTTYLGVAGFELAAAATTTTISGSATFSGSVRIQ